LPDLSGERYLDWDAPPSGQPLDTVRDIRDDIQARASELLQEMACAAAGNKQ
jgi:arsenate reductase (thioredoxin)